jgi:hypothetical protein
VGVSVFGVFISWSRAASALQGFGAQPIAYDPMLDYWLRMAAGAFALIGCWFMVLMTWPKRFYPAIPWSGGLMLIEGFILMAHGLGLSLPPLPFYADASMCLLLGSGIFFLSRFARPKQG